MDDGGALRFTAAGDDLFLLSDRVLHLEELLQQPLPQVPADPTFSMHWLAIDGVQPLIPQNPAPAEASQTAAGATAAGPATAPTRIVLDKSEKEVLSRPLVKHVLSKEQQLYYEYVTSALRGDDASLKSAVYKSVSEDDGLHQLLPYFTQFVAQEVANNSHNLTLLTALMRLTNCLMHSPYLHVEPYVRAQHHSKRCGCHGGSALTRVAHGGCVSLFQLQQLVPSVLTCIVGKQLCLDPLEDHWALRDYSAVILHFVCLTYAPAYPDLQPGITRTLLKAWMDPAKSLTTHYGCIGALAKLGHKVVKALVIPYVPVYHDVLSQSQIHRSLAARLLLMTVACADGRTAAVSDAQRMLSPP